jgi:large subunit ribosomal protein L21
MRKYAIIKLAGKQFVVQENDEFVVDRLKTEPGKTLTVKDVLLVKDGEKVTVGTPLLSKVTIKLKVIEDFKDKKIRVAKFKAKSRYRRVMGHRQQKSKVQVISIN